MKLVGSHISWYCFSSINFSINIVNTYFYSLICFGFVLWNPSCDIMLAHHALKTWLILSFTIFLLLVCTNELYFLRWIFCHSVFPRKPWVNVTPVSGDTHLSPQLCREQWGPLLSDTAAMLCRWCRPSWRPQSSSVALPWGPCPGWQWQLWADLGTHTKPAHNATGPTSTVMVLKFV